MSLNEEKLDLYNFLLKIRGQQDLLLEQTALI